MSHRVKAHLYRDGELVETVDVGMATPEIWVARFPPMSIAEFFNPSPGWKEIWRRTARTVDGGRYEFVREEGR